MDKVPRSPSPVHIHVDMEDLKKFTNKDSYPQLTEQKMRLGMASRTDLVAQNQLDVLGMFEPIMSEQERGYSLFTLDVFKRACEATNLTYFLVSGTMLGSIRHHGLIPWDDDFDIAMEADQWVKIRDVLGNINGFELYSPADSQWKFFMSSLPEANRPFKWPNIDIFFYKTDDTYLWSVTWGIKYCLTYRMEDVFPLHFRKFEYWDLPLPKENHFLSSLEFGKGYLTDCVTAHYVHKTNSVVAKKNIGLMPCSKIFNAFPFVFYHKGKVPGTIQEDLRVGTKSLGNITIKGSKPILL